MNSDTLPPALKAVFKHFTAALMQTLIYVRITRGGTHNARQHTHIFLPPEVTGGERGRLLCRSTWKEKQVLTTWSYIAIDICPLCQSKLYRLAAMCAQDNASYLYLAATGAAIDLPVVPASTLYGYLVRLHEEEHQSKRKATQQGLFAVDDAS